LPELENCTPDVILLSVEMTGLSGYDICRLLKVSDRWQKVPLLLLASKTSAEARAAVFRAGASDFVTKPVVGDELVHRVRTQLHMQDLENGARANQSGAVLSRSAFMQKMKEMRGKKEPISLALMGIKKFDVLGSRYGMIAQNSAAELASTILRSRFRYQDIRGRWSESIFAVAFPGETAEVAGAAVSLMCDEYARYELNDGKGKTFHSAMSFGFSVQAGETLDPQKLVEAAHRNLVATTYA